MKFFDIIFYNKGKGGENDVRYNNYWKKYRAPHWIYIFLMLILMGVGIGAVSLLLSSSYLGYSGNSMFVSYFTHPLVAVLNILPCILLVLLIYFISGRAWCAFTFSALIVFALSLVNYYKIRLRAEAFIPADFVFAKAAAGILPNYTLEITGRVIITAAAFVFGILCAVFFMRGKLKKAGVRIIGIALTLAACAGLYFHVYTSDEVYRRADNSEDINVWSDLQVYVSKGFLYPFINKIPDAFPTAPEGYDEDNAADILSQYEDDGIDNKVDIIAVMFEAYSDLSEFPGIELTSDIYAPLHKLQKESVSGKLIANVFGGGTVDTERNFLTGYTKNEEYRGDVNSYVRYLSSQGYHTEGLHTGDGWFYNRQNINKYLGFDDYYFLEDFENSSRADRFFFETLSSLYEKRDKDVPYFNFSVTYQNHGAYDSKSTGETAYLKKGSLSDESYNILNNYLTGIADTTKRMGEFVDGFRKSKEPVIIVLFGDHKPWLGDSSEVYGELGINLDLSTAEGFYNYYSAPYLIWANDAAKKTLGNGFSGKGDTVSSCFLMNELFLLNSWKGPGYMKLSNELLCYTGVVNSASGHYMENGKLSKELSPEADAFFKSFKIAEYYMKHNLMY